MEEKFNLNQLLQKPIAMMTGEELCFLITKSVESTEKATSPIAPKGNYYGIEGIARVFGCSVPTANRIKKSMESTVPIFCKESNLGGEE